MRTYSSHIHTVHTYIHTLFRCIQALRDTHDEILSEHVNEHPHDIFGLGEKDVTGKLFANRDRYMLVYTYMHTYLQAKDVQKCCNRDRYMSVY
jgi:hypothetical protein